MKDYLTFPQIIRECHVHTTPFESWLLYNTGTKNYFSWSIKRISHNQEEVLFNCDGRSSIRHIKNLLASAMEIPPSEVSSTLSFFTNLGILSLEDSPAESALFPSFGGSRDYYVPLHVFLELTDSCNQKCIHCYRESSPDKSSYASTGKLLEFIKRTGVEGTLVCEITGGEPLLHPDFETILSACAESFEVTSVITNGTLIDEYTAAVFRDISHRSGNILVSITLNSHLREFHDNFAGLDGSFDAALNALRLLKQVDLPVRVSMNVVPQNLDHIERTAELALNKGADLFAAATLNPFGRATAPFLHDFTPEQWAQFEKTMKKLQQTYPDRIFQLPEHAFQDYEQLNCGAGTRSVAVSPDGNVRPCVLYPEDLSLGNIFENDFEKVFTNQFIELLNSLRTPGENSCGNCTYLSFCNGCIFRGIIASSLTKKECPMKTDLSLKLFDMLASSRNLQKTCAFLEGLS